MLKSGRKTAIVFITNYGKKANYYSSTKWQPLIRRVQQRASGVSAAPWVCVCVHGRASERANEWNSHSEWKRELVIIYRINVGMEIEFHTETMANQLLSPSVRYGQFNLVVLLNASLNLNYD